MSMEACMPSLCIDIHEDVRTGESALLGVQPFLEELGYRVEMVGHALYAERKPEGSGGDQSA